MSADTPTPPDVRDARFQFEFNRHKIVGLLTDLKIAFDTVAAIHAPPTDDAKDRRIRELEESLREAHGRIAVLRAIARDAENERRRK